METSVLLNSCSQKYSRAFKNFQDFISKDNYFSDNKLDFNTANFNIFRGFLYSFFESHSIYITTTPYDIKSSCKWNYFIYIDNIEIAEADFTDRETAEYIAFLKCFQFLDTKLFIELSQNRFYDQSSDVSCLNMDWEHLNKVLNYKRINLLANG